MEPEFNLERTRSALLIINGGLKYGRWNFLFVSQRFFSDRFLHLSLPGERWRGGVGREAEKRRERERE